MPIEPSGAARSTTYTVLVAEDEPAILRLLVTVLEQQGFEVLAAGSGDEALTRVEEHAGEVDLLVTDVVMPGLSGTELAERLRVGRPRLDVLFISGYTDHPEAMVEAPAAGGAARTRFLGKPFAPDRLLASLRQIVSDEAWPVAPDER